MKNLWKLVSNFLRRKAEKSPNGVYWFFKKTIRWCVAIVFAVWLSIALCGCTAQAFHSVWDRFVSGNTIKNSQKITDNSVKNGVSPAILLALAVIISGQNWLSNRKTRRILNQFSVELDRFADDAKRDDALVDRLVVALIGVVNKHG